MADQFIGEIRIFAGNFNPVGWALCNGQLMAISQNTALFSLLGTQYGGNGTSTFALPNLQGMAPLAYGQGPGLSQRVIGETGGEQSVTITTPQLPQHNHPVRGTSAAGNQTSPAGAILATPGASRGAKAYDPSNADVTLNPGALAATGGNAPHNNLPPYLVLNFIIALQGIFPSRA